MSHEGHPVLNVRREIHAPGLDMHEERINMHRIFQYVVHDQIVRIGAFAWKHYEKQGRGAVFVNERQWREAIREQHWERAGDEIVPFAFVADGAAAVGVDLAPLGKGYEEMVKQYDPEREIVLVVQHPPGDLISAYLIVAVPPPKEACERINELASGAGTPVAADAASKAG
jgi:hypothetical protein